MDLDWLRATWPWLATCTAALATMLQLEPRTSSAIDQRMLTLIIAGRQLCLSVSLQSATLFFVGLYQLLLAPVRRPTKDFHNPRSSHFKALRAQHFPPGFPNGWHCVCNAKDIENGRVKSISALGTYMVAFRGQDKTVRLPSFTPSARTWVPTWGWAAWWWEIPCNSAAILRGVI
ncbi:unnamed protein product [Symbiodinium sp. CCMP2456]|nr:unnamed protein product [Symbiodinium sp. CCMP2456]